jgi:acetyl esterase/lipase
MKLELKWLTLGLLALLGVWIYLHFGQNIVFYVRLLNAKRVADKFYASYGSLSKDIAYGPGAAQRLDIYRPETGEGYPVLVYVHGGSWNSGNKALYSPVAQRLLPEGMVVVVPGYTLYPNGTYRQQVEDVASALAWTLENIEQHGGDLRRVIVGGQSAGAHLTALALFDERWLAAYGHTASEFCGWYGISGPYDIQAQMDYEIAQGRAGQLLVEVMEGKENFAAVSPTTYAHAELPPILLIHGDADRTVPLSIAQNFQAKLEAAGATSKLLVYPGAGHSGLLFDALAQNPAQLVTDLTAFALNCPPTNF